MQNNINNFKKQEGGLRTLGKSKSSSNEKPLISIVTVVYNGKAFLEDTILSVINQTYDNIEYIIIDGGSTDGTLDIIKKYESKIDYWVSEPDDGIYDAMNKGIDLATGEFIGLINSDDWYELDAVQKVVEEIQRNPMVEIIYGDMLLIDVGTGLTKLVYAHINTLSTDMNINHPTCFVKNDLYKERKFDTEYKIASDYDLMLYHYISNKKFSYIKSILANMRNMGISRKAINLTTQERFTIHQKYFSLSHANMMLLKLKCKMIVKKFLEVLLPSNIYMKIKGWK